MNKSDVKPTIQDAFLDHPYSLGGRVIDPVLGTLSWQGFAERLRRKELEVLALLASVEGVVSRQAFIDVIWHGNNLVGDHAITVAISSLRQALHDSQSEHPLVRTIPRRGYQLSERALQPVPQTIESTVAKIEVAAHNDVPIAAFGAISASPSVSLQLSPGHGVPGCPGWRLLRRLGQSERSESWLAEASEFNSEEHTGLRVFRFCKSEAYLRRLQREVTLLRYVNESLSEHPGFAVIRDWQLDEPPYYLARDYSNFGSLIEWSKASEAPPTPPLALMAQLSEALAALHALGVVHRNLGADRILVDETDAGPQFKMSALGLAALSDRSKLAPLQITALGLTMGTEDSSAQTSSADDVAALGLVFLQLILGDWQAAPSENWLSKVADAELQTLLRHCVGPSRERPTAAELAQRLHALLAPSAKENSVASPITPAALTVSGPVSGPAAPIRAANPPSAPETIGPYRLLDQLGEGGMGTVYLAEQRDPYRKVALKIIRAGLDGKQILSRFDAERQALAMMNHPNVASVHDSGLASDGRPYFAMEYIIGEEITQYSDAHHLNIHARVKLFLQVCDGVLHAHQKGVLHRDIKPSNLMVSSAPESAGTVKVIDFGLAKSLHGKLAAHTLHTSFGAFIGTPVYSSPEHVLGAATGVDTRSDIYSMGVVLYELLAGMTPIAGTSLENLEPEKVRELVCQSKLPSMREQLQNTSAEKRIALAEHRAIKVDELPKTLDGDLSWVVGKCLERDPNDRYASVLALKEDLQRWLELRPVEARPTTSWYRFRKLVRRNRGASILIAASVASLLLTTSAAIFGFLRAESALKRAEASSQEAEQAADFQAAQISSMDPQAMALSWRNYLLEAVTENSAAVKLDPNIDKTQIDLNRALKGVNFAELVIKQLDEHYFQPSLKLIENDHAKSPRLKATLLQSIASSMYRLGLVDAAIPAQEQAIAIRAAEFGVDAELTLASQVQLGILLVDSSKSAEAEALLTDAIDRIRSATGGDTVASLTATAQLGYIASGMGNLDKAEAYYREAWTGSKRLLGENDPQTLGFAINLGHILRKKRKLEEAERIIAFAYKQLLSKFGPSNPSTIEAMRELAQLRLNQSLFQEALELGTEVMQNAEIAYGRYSLTTISTVNDMGLYQRAIGQHEKALALFTDAFARYEKINFTGSDVVITRLNIGTALFELGRLSESESYLQPVLDVIVEQAGWDSELTLVTASRLANLRIAQGRFVEAATLLRRIIEQRAKAPDPNYAALALARSALGQTLLALGKTDEAKQMLTTALESSQKLVPEQTSITLRVQSLLALTLPASDAVSMLKETITKQSNTIAVTANDKVLALLALAKQLNELGQSKEALFYAGKAIEQVRQALSKDHYLVAAALLQQAQTWKSLGNKLEAQSALSEAQRIIAGTATLDPIYQKEADKLAVGLGD